MSLCRQVLVCGTMLLSFIVNGCYIIMAITVLFILDVWLLSMLCVVDVLLCVLVCFVSYSGALYLCKIRPDNELRMISAVTGLLYAGLFSLAQAGAVLIIHPIRLAVLFSSGWCRLLFI